MRQLVVDLVFYLYMSVSLLRGNLIELDKYSFTKSQPACTANKLTYVNRKCNVEKCNVNVVNSCTTYVKVYNLRKYVNDDDTGNS